MNETPEKLFLHQDLSRLVIPDKPTGTSWYQAVISAIDWPNRRLSVTIEGGTTVMTNVPFLQTFFPVVGTSVWLQKIDAHSFFAVGSPQTPTQFTYVPTLTGITLGNGTMDASYNRVGRQVDYKGRLIAGTTTTFSGNLQVSLPFPIQFEADIQGSAIAFNPGGAGAGRLDGHCYAPGGSTLGFIFNQSVAGYMVVATATTPFTWANAFQLHFSVRYETTLVA